MQDDKNQQHTRMMGTQTLWGCFFVCFGFLAEDNLGICYKFSYFSVTSQINTDIVYRTSWILKSLYKIS